MPSPYASLCAYGRQNATMQSVAALLGWDQETYMPRGGGAARAEQSALMAGLLHERATSPQLGELIAACESDDALDELQRACVREFRRDYDRATRLPRTLVEELARTGSQAQEAWKDARAKSDFSAFAPWLAKMVDLTRQKARCYPVSEGGELYDALLDEYEPGATARQVQAVFEPLAERLSALIRRVAEDGQAPDDAPLGIQAPRDRQHALGLQVLEAIGFDLQRGRLDVTTHPFCQGIGPGDTRLTTRYDERYFPGALYGTLHEAGHGLYEQGLPKASTHPGPNGEPIDCFGTPLAESVSLGIHESQSRLWENMVGRSESFWAWLEPLAKDALAALGSYDREEIYRAVNIVRPSYIRVEADEGTYNLHVMLRFELERALVAGDLAIDDLPAAWNDRFEQLLGLQVPDDAHGCLQDVHWSFGLFGYFPTYTLGNLYAAQFWQALGTQMPGLDDDVRKGDFAPLLAWLNTNIHAHGRRFSAGQLCERVTGRSLEADPLLDYLTTKLQDVYRL
ncbi:MAG: thermostable carboxypeptidase 1 [Phycisphaerales bacterium]|nr:MAG: thermostable carboxypeptidase 1 [Phycisphaerales bacterium]